MVPLFLISSVLPLPNTSPTLLETSVSSFEHNRLSPVPGSSAFCFFNGLPTNSPFDVFAVALTLSGTAERETDEFGGVVDRVDGGGFSPEPVLIVESVPELLASGSDECCRLSCCVR